MEKTKLLHRVAHTMRKKPAYASAIIVAAGSAQRMEGEDKVMALLDGKPMIEYALRAFNDAPMIRQIIVVTRQDLLGSVSELATSRGFQKVAMVVCGGATRTESVQIGLRYVAKQTDIVAIHDAARPFVSRRIIEQTLCLAAKTGAAAPAIPVKDTIKCVRAGVITQTPERSRLAAVQTPQCFDKDMIVAALEKALRDKLPLTDDCAAMERLGLPVHLTQGDERNFKLTTPQDLLLARTMLEMEKQP